MNLRILFWRNFYRVVNPFRRLYWWIFKPQTRGVKCLVEDNDKFLFTRIAYGHKQWTLPGGGVKRNESFKQAALRELYEETGIKLEDMEFFAEYKFQIEYKQDAVQCFYAKVSKPELLPDMLEVAEAQWFSRKDLPQPRRGTADKILTFYDEWKQKQV